MWWGRNAGKFKKKRILQKEIGGEFLGKSKKKVWEHFGGGVKKNFRGAIFGKIPQKKFEGGILGGEVMLGGRVVGEECWEFKKKKNFAKTNWGGGIWGGHWGEKIGGPL